MTEQERQSEESSLERASREYVQSIGNVKEELKRVEETLLEVYFCKIKEVYFGATPSRKNRINKFLEGLTGLDNSRKYAEDKEHFCVFDCENAKRIRKEAGFTQRQLGEKFGVSGQYISQVERGDRGIGPKGKEYMLWLKENGYN